MSIEALDRPDQELAYQTPLYVHHVEHGARMVPSAGYEMPFEYGMGQLREHHWTRDNAGLMDVSHVGLALLHADNGRHKTVAEALEALAPADILNLSPGQQRYTQLTNAQGGIIDHITVARPSGAKNEGLLSIVVSAVNKDAVFKHVASHLASDVELYLQDTESMIALQGPSAAKVLQRYDARAADIAYRAVGEITIAGHSLPVTRAGYTGEDGFELKVPSVYVTDVWRDLLEDNRVAQIGIGAQNSLRLEAGLCAYGWDIDETVSPIEAGLAWSIQQRRREVGRFLGEERILYELAEGPARRRVGILPTGRTVVSRGATVHLENGLQIGTVTSGLYGPTCDGPVAMGYVDARHAAPETEIQLVEKNQSIPGRIAALPLVPHKYVR